MSERLEIFRIRPVGLKEGANLERAFSPGNWQIKADRYNDFGGLKGRLIVTLMSPREIAETSPEGFVTSRAPYDFV